MSLTARLETLPRRNYVAVESKWSPYRQAGVDVQACPYGLPALFPEAVETQIQLFQVCRICPPEAFTGKDGVTAVNLAGISGELTLGTLANMGEVLSSRGSSERSRQDPRDPVGREEKCP